MRQHLRNIGLIVTLSFYHIAYADRYDSCDGDCTGAGSILFFKVAISLALIYFIGSKVLDALLWLLAQNSFFENFIYTTLIFGFIVGPIAYGITGSATFAIFIAIAICFLLSFKTDFVGGEQTSKPEIKNTDNETDKTP